PISILESGDTIVRAFFEAGAWALISIAILLWIVLRRFGDVLLTIVPLLLAGVVTLELCVVFGMALNFANIIALPLLLGIGVAFKIYFLVYFLDYFLALACAAASSATRKQTSLGGGGAPFLAAVCFGGAVGAPLTGGRGGAFGGGVNTRVHFCAWHKKLVNRQPSSSS